LAEFVRSLHSHRIYHRDLSAKNILVTEDDTRPRFWLIDVSDVRRRPPSLRRRIRNLGQLDQMYVKPSRTDRLRFYRHYARGRPELVRRDFLAEIDAISRARHEHWLESDEAKRFQEQHEAKESE
jgi:serine/threonine protein kinase